MTLTTGSWSAGPRTEPRRPRVGARYPIAVLGRALDLLDTLEHESPLSLTELSGRSGIHKATALRILSNLESRGYVARDEVTARYRLGFRLAQLGTRVTAGLNLREVARPLLCRLHDETGETVNLAVPNSGGIVYVDILESSHGLRMASSVGAEDCLHSTALGKAILAFWPQNQLVRYLATRTLIRKTRKTIVRADLLRTELRRTRDRGYALDDEENELGARCIGAPVFGQTGQVLGSVSVSAPVARLSLEHLAATASRVAATAHEISRRIGFRDRPVTPKRRRATH